MVKRDSNFNPLGKSRGLGRGRGKAADWASANATLLLRAVETASCNGGALLFGYTRDLGAYSVRIYGDGDPYTVVIAPSNDIDITLQDIIDLFEEIGHDPDRTPEPLKNR